MLHFFSIFSPQKALSGDDHAERQKPFFGPEIDTGLSRAEADAAVLTDKLPLPPEAGSPMTTRFVTLLSPPFL